MLQTFETERLIIRERTLEDMEACIKMDRDPEVVKFIPEVAKLIKGSLESEHREFIRKRMETEYPIGMGYWAIETKTEPIAFIGWVMLNPIDMVGPEIEIGWRLKRNFWGKGFATEAANTILQYALNHVEAEEVVADIHGLNKGSIRVAEKIGLKREITSQDVGNDFIRFAILRMQ